MAVMRKFSIKQISGPNIRGAEGGGTHALSPRELLVGRSERADIEVSVATVSREHAAIWAAEDTCFVRDLNSGHGTFVNSKRITEATSLHEGDVLALGQEVVFLVSAVDNKKPEDLKSNATGGHHVGESSLAELALADIPSDVLGNHFDASCAFDLALGAAAPEDEQQLVSTAIETLRVHLPPGRIFGYLGDGSNALTMVAYHSDAPTPIAEQQPPIQSILRRGFIADHVVSSLDAQRDARSAGLAVPNVRSTICTPMSSPEGPLGVLYADTAGHASAHDRDDGRLLQLAGSMLGRRISLLRLSGKLGGRQAGPARDHLDEIAGIVNSHLNRLEMIADDLETELGLSGPVRLMRAENSRLRRDLDTHFKWRKRSKTDPTGNEAAAEFRQVHHTQPLGVIPEEDER